MTHTSATIRSSHSFVSRPFVGIETIDRSLDLVELVIDGTRFSQGSVNLSPSSLPFKSATLEVFFDVAGLEHAIEEMGIRTDQIHLACIIYGTIIAESEVIFDSPVSLLESPLTIPVESESLILESPNGFDLRVFLYLAKNLKRRALRPSDAGTWLAHTQFSVSPFTSLSRFAPIPLDPTIRAAFDLPATCMTYVNVGEALNEVDALDEEVDVYVDSGILRLLEENPTDPLCIYIQVDLVTLTLISVLTKSSQLLQSGSSDVSDLATRRVPISGIYEAVSRASVVSQSDIFSAAIGNPGKLRSYVETFVKTTLIASAALRTVR